MALPPPPQLPPEVLPFVYGGVAVSPWANGHAASEDVDLDAVAGGAAGLQTSSRAGSEGEDGWGDDGWDDGEVEDVVVDSHGQDVIHFYNSVFVGHVQDLVRLICLLPAAVVATPGRRAV